MSKLLNSIEKFIKFEATAGILLLISAIAAIIFANSGASYLYYEFVNLPINFSFGIISSHSSLGHFVNDGLMAVFFLVVSLEIKQELMIGHLSSSEQRNLPLIAALAGVIVPAVIFYYFNSDIIIGGDKAISGWAIPTATDIAFALGILALFGKRVPIALKVFLMALAIIDDLIAILIIALFYNTDLSIVAILSSVAVITILAMLNVAGVKKKTPYLCLGFILWVCVLNTGIHATLAGVLLGLFIPLSVKNDPKKSPLKELIKELHYLVGFCIVPLFAFVNSGIILKGISLSSLFSDPIALGIMTGLFLGKQIGIFGIIYGLVKTGLCKKPANSSWSQIYGVTLLAGIGFTMSIFVGNLAYPGNEIMITSAKMGIIFGSALSAIIGFTALQISCKTELDNEIESDLEEDDETINEDELASDENKIDILSKDQIKLMTPEQRKAYKSALKAEKLALKIREKAEAKARKELLKKENKAKKLINNKNNALNKKEIQKEQKLMLKELAKQKANQKIREKINLKTEKESKKITKKTVKQERKATDKLEKAALLAKKAEKLKFNSSVKIYDQDTRSSRAKASEALKKKLQMLQAFAENKKISNLEKRANNERLKAEKIIEDAKKMEQARNALLNKRIANFEKKIKSSKNFDIKNTAQGDISQNEILSEKLASLKEMFHNKQDLLKNTNIENYEIDIENNKTKSKNKKKKIS